MYVTVKEASARTGLNIKTIYQRMQNGYARKKISNGIYAVNLKDVSK